MSQLKYLTNDIDELESAEHDLEKNGVPREHIHVLANNDGELLAHNLPPFSDWSKRDILHYGIRGTIIGLLLSSAILLGCYLYGVSDPTAWIVIAFVATLVVGFCAWEGGLVGINKMNHAFEKYKDSIQKGAYLLVVDPTSNTEENKARSAVASHPDLHSVS